MAYRDPKKATEMLRDILADLKERGMENIQERASGAFIHVTADDPKKKRRIQVFGKPYAGEA